ncbi:MAG: DUF4433 domain-containing protein [Myxococcota bacterium]|nr:DUF4433 domain-containing protein [Myxococcota bacterium]
MTDILHFTHLDNLATIIQDGGLYSDAEIIRLQRKTARSGNAQIKQRRLSQPIHSGVGMGGYVGEYVPFYFAPRSPMLYIIQCGAVPGVSSDQDQIVYLVSNALAFAAPSFVVTDGNAAATLTRHYGTHAALQTQVDWALMKSTYWNDTDQDGDRKRRRSAEFLVHRFVQWPSISELVTRTSATQQAVLALYSQLSPGHQPPIHVRSSWYY